jgi:hypothetical protein
MAGALVPTFLISRVILWLAKSWDGGIPRLLVVHVLSWLMCSYIAAMGMADGGAFAGVEAAFLYGVPQAVWLLFDLVRTVRKRRRGFP